MHDQEGRCHPADSRDARKDVIPVPPSRTWHHSLVALYCCSPVGSYPRRWRLLGTRSIMAIMVDIVPFVAVAVPGTDSRLEWRFVRVARDTLGAKKSVPTAGESRVSGPTREVTSDQ